MNARVVVAGVLAGLTVFLWTTVSHTVCRSRGRLTPLPDQENCSGRSAASPPSAASTCSVVRGEAKMTEAWRTQPRGLLALTPAGQEFTMSGALAKEAISDVVGGLFLAFLLAASGATFGAGSTASRSAPRSERSPRRDRLLLLDWYGFRPPTSRRSSSIRWSAGARRAGRRLVAGAPREPLAHLEQQVVEHRHQHQSQEGREGEPESRDPHRPPPLARLADDWKWRPRKSKPSRPPSAQAQDGRRAVSITGRSRRMPVTRIRVRRSKPRSRSCSA